MSEKGGGFFDGLFSLGFDALTLPFEAAADALEGAVNHGKKRGENETGEHKEGEQGKEPGHEKNHGDQEEDDEETMNVGRMGQSKI